MKNTHLRSPIKQARGLGAARSGTAHFIAERLTSLALVPLCLWFVIGLLSALLNPAMGGLMGWMQSPFSALMMILFIGLSFWHSKLGMQVIIEDYVHKPFWRNLLLLKNLVLHVLLGALSLMAVVQLHFRVESVL